MNNSYIIVEPIEEPFTIAEARDNLRQDSTAEDSIILRLIRVARGRAEHITGRRLVTQTREVTTDSFPIVGMKMPDAPLLSVTSIKYFDANGVEQTLVTSVYQVDTKSNPGRIALKPNQVWPTIQRDVFNPITIRYTCGYGAAALVPEEIKQAMHIMIAHWYENREPIIVGTIVAEVPMSVMTLLRPFRPAEV